MAVKIKTITQDWRLDDYEGAGIDFAESMIKAARERVLIEETTSLYDPDDEYQRNRVEAKAVYKALLSMNGSMDKKRHVGVMFLLNKLQHDGLHMYLEETAMAEDLSNLIEETLSKELEVNPLRGSKSEWRRIQNEMIPAVMKSENLSIKDVVIAFFDSRSKLRASAKGYTHIARTLPPGEEQEKAIGQLFEKIADPTVTNSAFDDWMVRDLMGKEKAPKPKLLPSDRLGVMFTGNATAIVYVECLSRLELKMVENALGNIAEDKDIMPRDLALLADLAARFTPSLLIQKAAQMLGKEDFAKTVANIFTQMENDDDY